MELNIPLKVEVEAKGSFRAPEVTEEDLRAMAHRAGMVRDQQIMSDMFRLIAEVKRLRREC